jgi:diguanylate cyclase (GGDEF)-like protein
VLAQAKEMLRADSAEVTFLSTAGGRGAVRVVLPASDRLQRDEMDCLEVSAWMWARVVDSEQPALLAKGGKEPAHQRFLQHLGYRDAIITPLRGEAGVIGTLLVGDRIGDVRTFDAGDVRLLETVANHAGVALQNGRLIDQLRHEALHDSLTGLPNRVYLQREVKAALDRLDRGESVGCTVGLMDLDGFKEINDTLGHQHGDQLLQEIARRLTWAADGAVVARLGGDEFAFLVADEIRPDAALRFARRLLHALDQPVDLDGVDVQIGASIGLACAPEHARDASGVLKRADLAMYDAKGAGAGARLYEPAMDTTDPQRLALVGELRHAIEHGELKVHVQPKASLITNQITGVEALVRWKHPTLGSVPPDQFVPVAERSGLIRPLTMLVLRQALEACATWRATGREISVAVNLSARSLVDLDLVDDVSRLLRRYDVPPHLLTLELTESSVMTDPARAMGLLVSLQDMGVRLSIDDFGTGYSSLSYLKRLPVHEVKIDRSFITHMVTDADDATIVRSIIDLARNLSLDVVAEGVEDREAWLHLAALGCTSVQGYHLARPMPLEEFPGWLAAYVPTAQTGLVPLQRSAG